MVISSSIDPDPGLFGQALPRLVSQAGVPVFVGGTTAVRHRRSIESTGTIPVGADIEDGVRLIVVTIAAMAR